MRSRAGLRHPGLGRGGHRLRRSRSGRRTHGRGDRRSRARAPVDPAGCARLAASGVQILRRHDDPPALGRDSVEGATIVRSTGRRTKRRSPATRSCSRPAPAPAIELFDVAGAAIVFRPDSGGHVPLVDADGRTTVPMLFGSRRLHRRQADDPVRRARAEGMRAARAAAAAIEAGAGLQLAGALNAAGPQRGRRLRRVSSGPEPPRRSRTPTRTYASARRSLADLLGVKPPRYLSRDQAARRARDLASLAAEGPINQDQVKRLTRAGMGPCQGRRCREQIGAALAAATGSPLGRNSPRRAIARRCARCRSSAFADADGGARDGRPLGGLVRHREPVDSVLGAARRRRTRRAADERLRICRGARRSSSLAPASPGSARPGGWRAPASTCSSSTRVSSVGKPPAAMAAAARITSRPLFVEEQRLWPHDGRAARLSHRIPAQPHPHRA